MTLNDLHLSAKTNGLEHKYLYFSYINNGKYYIEEVLQINFCINYDTDKIILRGISNEAYRRFGINIDGKPIKKLNWFGKLISKFIYQ